MLIGHDHPIFIVADPGDLDRIADGFARLGFSISRRDDDDAATAPTENRLICFADGSYVEILTIRDEEHRRKHRFAPLFAAGDGWIDYSVHTNSLLDDQQRLEAAGAPTRGPLLHAKRLRNGSPWSVSLVLAGIGIGQSCLPLLVQDESPRLLRVPDQNVSHANGVTGIAGVAVVVENLMESEPALSALFGAGAVLPRPYEGAAEGKRYMINTRWVDIVEADAGRSPLRSRLEQRGDGVFEVIFARGGDRTSLGLDTSAIQKA